MKLQIKKVIIEWSDKMKKYKKDYAVYNQNDELLTVGTLKECAIDLGIKYNSIIQYRLRQEKKKQSCNKYKIVEIED